MSKHSQSLRTSSLISQPTSFFDTAPNVENFWKKKSLDEEEEGEPILTQPALIENEFKIHHKKFFREWESCTLSMHGNYLVYRKKKNKKYFEYIDFTENMYRMEMLSPLHKKYSAKYPNGFSLYANGRSMEFFCKDKAQVYCWLPFLRKHCILTNFNDNYKMLEVIGTGGYGKVHILESIKGKKNFAGKFIKLSSQSGRERQRAMIINEIQMLRKLDHPQIVQLYEVYELQGQICLVTELINGDKLFNYITERRPVSEESTAYIMKQLLLILSYLKTHDIIHRDIKSENILYTIDEQNKVNIKLIDFGLGTYNKNRNVVKKCGTAGYVAPEILNNQPFSFKVDLYSAGVIMYTCLMGRPAFYGRNYDELLERNKKGVIKFKGTTWTKLSNEAQDLLQRILDQDPYCRISLVDALNHEWFVKKLSPEDRKDLSEFIFQIVKLNVPQEKNISKIPTTSGQLPFIDKTPPMSLQSIGSQQKVGSHSFLTSNVLAGNPDQKDINSFYRVVSNGSCVSQVSLNGSHTSLSRTYSRNLTNQNTVVPSRSYTLALPNLHLNSFRNRHARFNSMKSDDKRSEVEPSNLNKKYIINVLNPVSLDDLDVACEDEGSLCSDRYADLVQNSIRFPKVTGKSPRKRSLSEIDISWNQNRSLRLETDTETPRIKLKVAAVNQEVRNQIATLQDR